MAPTTIRADAVDPNLKLLELCTKKAWWRVPHLVKLNLLLLIPFLTSYVGGFDSSMLNGIQSVPAWQEYFDYPRGAILGVFANMQVIGGAVSLPLAPWAADRFGRRHPIAFGSLVIILGGLVQGFAKSFAMFLAGRFCIGLGAGFVSTAAPPLLGELSYPSHRPIFTSIYNCCWSLGAIVAAWSTYGTFRMTNDWSWRIPSLLQIVVSLVQLCIYLVPESPRWLVANGRVEEATRILNIHHTGVDEPNELVRLQIAEIVSAIEFEQSSKSVSYVQFFRTKANRHRAFISVSLGFIIQWCGNALVSGFLVLVLIDSGVTNPETQNLINGLITVYNFLVGVTAATTVERFGRRKLFLTSTTGMLVAFTIWTILSAIRQQRDDGSSGLAIGIIAMIFVFNTFYNIAMAPLPISYLLEVLPYSFRTKGLTLFNLAQYCCGLMNGFVNPVGLENLRWRYYIVFIASLCVWFAVFYFFFPETRGLTLEEVAQLFDGREVLERTYEIKDGGLPEASHEEKVVVENKEK